MRKLIAVIILLPLLWSGYWFAGSYGLKSGIDVWLTDRRGDGWQVEYQDISVKGFPNRFDTEFEQIQLADPDTGVSWEAPFFQLLALSYKPNHLIAVWPNSQVLATPYQKIDVTSEDMKASIVVEPNPEMTVQRGTLIAENIGFASTSDWDFDVDAISMSLRQIDATEYGFSILANNLHPSENLRMWVSDNQNLPAFIENVSIDFEADLTKPFDRSTIEQTRPQVKTLKISKASASWGELLLRASGTLGVSSKGTLSGELTLNAKNWREMLQVATSAGAISAEVAAAAELGLGLFARLNGSEKTLDTTLTFSNGRMSMGPIPLGKAPRLVIR